MKDCGAQAVRCPLCAATAGFFARVESRDYLGCSACGLVFLMPAQRLSLHEERAHYATHRNDPGDERYRAFLAQLATPLSERLGRGARGLDYGAGPGPALAVMLEERGFPMHVYDPCFAPDAAALAQSYDFIVCSETAEHFHEPGTEFARLNDLLRPGGWFGLMTQWLDDEIDFARWHYRRDPTHVCFYRLQTLHQLAARHGWRLDHLAGRGVALFQKQSSP